jgi:hypothetical protein
MLGNSLVNVRDVVFLHTVYVVNVRLLSLELCEVQMQNVFAIVPIYLRCGKSRHKKTTH